MVIKNASNFPALHCNCMGKNIKQNKLILLLFSLLMFTEQWLHPQSMRLQEGRR
jgi:hypothetical protein